MQAAVDGHDAVPENPEHVGDAFLRQDPPGKVALDGHGVDRRVRHEKGLRVVSPMALTGDNDLVRPQPGNNEQGEEGIAKVGRIVTARSKWPRPKFYEASSTQYRSSRPIMATRSRSSRGGDSNTVRVTSQRPPASMNRLADAA